MTVLVLNAGSTSLKFKLYDMPRGEVMAEGNCQKVGRDDATLKYTNPRIGKIDRVLPILTHADALKMMLELLKTGETKVIESEKDIAAVAHRISQGGRYDRSVLIDADVIANAVEMTSLVPLHGPAQVRVIKDCQNIFGHDFKMVVGFDTAFNATIPKVAHMYAVPYRLYEKHNFRRYGYHGLSYQFVAERYGEITGKSLDGTRIAACHLGGGASVCAIKDGKAVDNTFGMGTGQGPACGTRAGTVDHAGIGYLMEREGLTYQEAEDMLHKESGLLGLSGISGDEKELEDAALKGDDRAKLALDYMAYQIKTYIGSYAFAMGGLDTIIFTGGIGENSDYMRAAICDGLGEFGIKMDADLNRDFNRSEHKISASDSTVEIWIIPTNEELVLARDAVRLIEKL